MRTLQRCYYILYILKYTRLNSQYLYAMVLARFQRITNVWVCLSNIHNLSISHYVYALQMLFPILNFAKYLFIVMYYNMYKSYAVRYIYVLSRYMCDERILLLSEYATVRYVPRCVMAKFIIFAKELCEVRADLKSIILFSLFI